LYKDKIKKIIFPFLSVRYDLICSSSQANKINFTSAFKSENVFITVDLAISESAWDQKIEDIKKYDVDIFGMGHDWQGHFDELKEHCEVIYLPRTDGISSSDLKAALRILDKNHVDQLKQALDTISSIVERFN